MNGNVIPVGGIKLIDEPILTKACKHNKKHKLKIVLEINRFEGLEIDFLANIKNTGYKDDKNNPNKTPNSSIKIANIKSLWDSGIEYLSCPSPNPTPKIPPVLIADRLLETWELSPFKKLSILIATWSKKKYVINKKNTPMKLNKKKSLIFLKYKIKIKEKIDI